MNSNESSFYCRLCAEIKKYDKGKFINMNDKSAKTYYTALSNLNYDFLDWDNKLLPTTICKPCGLSVMKCYKFQNLVIKAQKVLNGIFKVKNEKKNVIVKQEPQEFIDTNKSNYVDSPTYDIKPGDSIKIESMSNSDHEDQCVNQNTVTYITIETKENVSKLSLKKKDRKSKLLQVAQVGDSSWANYDWACVHCPEKFDSIKKLREHSQTIHNVCYGFKCSECDNDYNVFNNYIEHVRQHRDYLRYYCQYCDKKFEYEKECSNHAVTHWEEFQICTFCGEQFPDLNELKKHTVLFKKRTLTIKCIRKSNRVKRLDNDLSSWDSYEWRCVYCYYTASSAQDLREHSKTIHRQCFTMKCADCLQFLTYFNVLVTHARRHRPVLVNHCQYCNYFCEDLTQLELHITHSHTKICVSCGECFTNEQSYFEHVKDYNVRMSISTPQEELVCKICNKAFKQPTTFKAHLLKHTERTKDYTCDECGTSFYTLGTLRSHKLSHEGLRKACLICKKLITVAKFKYHVKTHFLGKDFSCDTCGKSFRKKNNLRNHMMVHSDEANFKCEYCGKEFKRALALKTHLVQHTGEKPYACKLCDKKFGNWGNCNKHMLRKHNVGLGKTKQTEIGTVRIDEATGEAQVPSCDDIDVKEWADKTLQKKCRPPKKQKSNGEKKKIS